MKKITLLILSISLITLFNSCNNNDDTVIEKLDYHGVWSGTFSGDDSGTWTATIDNMGIATGSAISNVFSNTYTLNGSVNLENGQFSATIGEASTGAKFIGELNVSNTPSSGSGTWTNDSYNMSGVWEGSIKK